MPSATVGKQCTQRKDTDHLRTGRCSRNASLDDEIGIQDGCGGLDNLLQIRFSHNLDLPAFDGDDAAAFQF